MWIGSRPSETTRNKEQKQGKQKLKEVELQQYACFKFVLHTLLGFLTVGSFSHTGVSRLYASELKIKCRQYCRQWD